MREKTDGARREEWSVNETRQEAERRIVGVLVGYPERAAEVFDGLSPSDFQSGQLGKIFQTARGLFDAGKRIDQLHIRKEFQDNGGIPNWLNTTFVDCLADAQAYPSVVQDCKQLIVGQKHFSDFKRLAGQARTLEDAIAASKQLLGWEAGVTTPDEVDWSRTIDETLERQRRIKDGELSAGYGWGLPNLDRNVLLQPGKFYVVGGIKKGAKTLFGLSVLRHNLTQTPPVPCLLFTLEMTRHEIARRILSSMAKVDSRKIFTPYMAVRESDEITRQAEQVRRLPLTVNDAATLGSYQILARSLRWKYRNEVPDNTGIIVVDFLQLIEHDRKRAETEASAIKRIAYDLARLAKELKIVVIAVAQLRNEGEGEKPHLRFLEGSGGIAQAAEAILLVDLVHRRQGEHDGSWPADFNVIIAAQRTGESGVSIKCKADLRVGEFREATVFDG
jgi:replicative DNA helicase